MTEYLIVFLLGIQVGWWLTTWWLMQLITATFKQKKQ
jgi:hypothetical protein